MPGGEISVAIPRSSEKLCDQLKKEIESGKIQIGTLIVPKQLKKLRLDKNRDISITECTIEGRKIPLPDIRNRMNNKFEKLKLFNDKPCIDRYLIFWSDHSNILNHGYIQITVKGMWTTQTFLTDAEYFQR